MIMPSDGYVCITDVMSALRDKREKQGADQIQLSHLMETLDFQEKCNELLDKLKSKNLLRLSSFSKDGRVSISSIYDLSRVGLAYRKGKGETQRWFINPYLFVMLAIEMDPELYAEVMMWMIDGDMIGNHNQAGDAYIKMCSAVSKVVKDKNELSDKIKQVAKGINFVVFNKHEDGIRNSASKDELNDIIDLENVISALVDDGFLKDYDSIINYIGNKWTKKWGNPVLALKR